MEQQTWHSIQHKCASQHPIQETGYEHSAAGTPLGKKQSSERSESVTTYPPSWITISRPYVRGSDIGRTLQEPLTDGFINYYDNVSMPSSFMSVMPTGSGFNTSYGQLSGNQYCLSGFSEETDDLGCLKLLRSYLFQGIELLRRLVEKHITEKVTNTPNNTSEGEPDDKTSQPDPNVCGACQIDVIRVSQSPCKHIVCTSCWQLSVDWRCRICKYKVERIAAYDSRI